MTNKHNLLDPSEISPKNNTVRNSCLLIAAVIFLLLLAFVYVVSKDVTKAFELVEEGLVAENEKSQESNETMRNALIKSDTYKSVMEDIDSISNNFNALIDSTINELVTQSGGREDADRGSRLKNPKDYKISTRIMIAEKVGERIEQSIQQTHLSYLRILRDEFGVDTIKLPLKLNYDFQEKHNKTWSEMHFDHLPLMAVMPLLSKFKSDENASRAIMYGYIANQ